MDSFRPQKSPGSDRFLGLLSSSPPSPSPSFELHEDDIFSTPTDPTPNPNPNPSRSFTNPNPRSPLSPSSARFRREANFGILAALPEDDRKHRFLQRKPSISSSSSSASTSPGSSSSSIRMIPAIPKPKPMADYGGKMQHQSLPVNVPVMPGRGRPPPQPAVEMEEEEEEEMMLPPHEIVDRAQGKGEPLTTFSVLEGVGRTLKGRDLRRVRNAVWRKTGFLD